jgi:hypothetical protein
MAQAVFQILTDAGGNQTIIDTTLLKGALLHEVAIFLPATDALDNTADVTISMTNTPSNEDKVLYTATNLAGEVERRDRVVEYDTAGTPLTTYTYITLHGNFKVVVVQGGANKRATIVMTYFE